MELQGWRCNMRIMEEPDTNQDGVSQANVVFKLLLVRK